MSQPSDYPCVASGASSSALEPRRSSAIPIAAIQTKKPTNPRNVSPSITLDAGANSPSHPARSSAGRGAESTAWQSRAVATMADLDELALAMPQATKEVSDDGRPSYHVHGKLFCFHRGQRPDAIDPETGERMADVLMFRVGDLDEKDLLLADDRGLFFTTPHFNGYPAVLMQIPMLKGMKRNELRDLVVDAWLSRAQKRVAKAWLAENEPESDDLQ